MLRVFPRPSVLDSWPWPLARQVHVFHYAVHSVLHHVDLDSWAGRTSVFALTGPYSKFTCVYNGKLLDSMQTLSCTSVFGSSLHKEVFMHSLCVLSGTSVGLWKINIMRMIKIRLDVSCSWNMLQIENKIMTMNNCCLSQIKNIHDWSSAVANDAELLWLGAQGGWKRQSWPYLSHLLSWIDASPSCPNVKDNRVFLNLKPYLLWLVAWSTPASFFYCPFLVSSQYDFPPIFLLLYKTFSHQFCSILNPVDSQQTPNPCSLHAQDR